MKKKKCICFTFFVRLINNASFNKTGYGIKALEHVASHNRMYVLKFRSIFLLFV